MFRAKQLLATLILVLTWTTTSAQQVAYRADFDVMFDNVENSHRFFYPQSYFALKIAPEIGLQFAKYHRVMVGGNLRQNFGTSKFPTAIDLTAYYQFKNKNFHVAAGLFPNSFKSDFPKSFFETNDEFYRANISGLLFNHTTNAGSVEFLCDWYLADSEKLRDGFLIAARAEYGFFERYFLLGGGLLLNHFKDPETLMDCNLLERFQYNIYLGTDLRSALPRFDRFKITAGVMGSMERKRIKGIKSNWYNGMGWQIDLDLCYKGFNFTNNCYWGAPQMIYYGQYGDMVYRGSPYYNSYFYDRVEVGYTYRYRFLQVKGALVFHCTDKQIAAQQIVHLSVNFDDVFKKRARRSL